MTHPRPSTKVLIVALFLISVGLSFGQTTKFPEKNPRISFTLPSGWVLTKQDSGEFDCVPRNVLDELSPEAAENGDYSLKLEINLLPILGGLDADGLISALSQPGEPARYSDVELSVPDTDAVNTRHGLKILTLAGTSVRLSDQESLNRWYWLLLPQANQGKLNNPEDFFRAGQGPIVLIHLVDTPEADKQYTDDLDLFYDSLKALK